MTATVEQPKEIDEFLLYDADGDGRLKVDEFCHLLGSLGSPLSLAQRCELFDRIDQDSDGRMSCDEYVRWRRS